MIESSSDFPVEWENPDDANSFWILDLVHCPAPISRLDYDLRMHPFIVANNRSNGRFGLPVRTTPTLINGFIYNKVINDPVDPEAVPAILKACDESVRAVYGDLKAHWEGTWLPKVRAQMEAFAAFELGGASLVELRCHLVMLRDRVDALWELHNDLLLPSLLAMHDFEETHRDLFPEASQLDVFELLGGLPNKTTEANLKLWEIGREAAKDPALRELLVGTKVEEGLHGALMAIPQGRALWAEIEEYLAVYGQRSDDLYIDRPTWIDDPTPVLRGLREAALQPDRDLEGELRALTARREAELTKVRAALASFPGAVVEEYEKLLRAARMSTVLTEDHHFWIDCKITHHLRRAAIELGRRLEERGWLDGVDDVFHLELGEISALDEESALAPLLRERVAERKAELERFSGVTPPMILGVPRAFLPMDCAVMRVSMKFSGNIFQPPGEPGGDLVGMPGSSGKVRGPVRLIRTLEETSRLQPGDIMVTAFTLPSWTPFFASIAGVVTNIGGVLCHAAVVAREYGLPAVVGTVRGTEVLMEGQWIEVDGDAGVVRVVSEVAAAKGPQAHGSHSSGLSDPT